MGGSRLLRLFGLSLVGGFLAGALITLLLRWRRKAAAAHCVAERPQRDPEIVLMEVSS